MTKVSELSNEQLCEAISELREPKPDIPEYVPIVEIGLNKLSEGGNWRLVFMDAKYKPIDWLLSENWTRLLDELKSLKSFNLSYDSHSDTWCMNIVHRCLAEIESKERSVCEAWLIANGEGKYE